MYRNEGLHSYIHFAYFQFDTMFNLSSLRFSVLLKNLALEGRAATSSANRKHNAYKAIDGNTKRIFDDDSCIYTSRKPKKLWLRVDFVKPIEVYGIEITPGKIEMLRKYKSFIWKCK